MSCACAPGSAPNGVTIRGKLVRGGARFPPPPPSLAVCAATPGAAGFSPPQRRLRWPAALLARRPGALLLGHPLATAAAVTVADTRASAGAVTAPTREEVHRKSGMKKQ